MIDRKDILQALGRALDYSEGPSIVLPRKLVEAVVEELEGRRLEGEK